MPCHLHGGEVSRLRFDTEICKQVADFYPLRHIGAQRLQVGYLLQSVIFSAHWTDAIQPAFPSSSGLTIMPIPSEKP